MAAIRVEREMSPLHGVKRIVLLVLLTVLPAVCAEAQTYCDYYEVESNDTMALADGGGTIPGSFCWGAEITDGSEDYFRFDVTSATYVSLRTELFGTGDTILELLDTSGNVIASNDDAEDGRHSEIIGECLLPGQYYVSVRDYDGTGSYSYVVRVEGDLACTGPGSTCDYYEIESNDSMSLADGGGTIPGSFCWRAEIIDGNEDYFTFDVLADRWVTISTSLAVGDDTILSLISEQGIQIAFNDDHPSGGRHSFVHECLSPGRYFVLVDSYYGEASFPYTLHVEGVDPCPPAPLCPSPYVDDNVIVVHGGEVTEATAFAGESVTFRIYYFNPTSAAGVVSLQYTHDQGLSNVTALNGGQYDAATRSATWQLTGIPSCQGGYVELTGVVGDVSALSTRGTIRVAGSPDVTTNVARLNVCSPLLGWVPFLQGAKQGSKPAIQMKHDTTSGLLVCFDTPGMFAREVVADGTVFHRLSIPDYGSTADVGNPEVPFLGTIVEIPLDAQFTLNAYGESMELDCYNVYPAQELAPEHALYVAPPLVLDQAMYQTSDDYPGDLVVVTSEDIGIVRGHRIVLLRVHPVQYNPVTRKITAYSRIEVEVNYTNVDAQTEAPSSNILSPVFEELLEASVLNYDLAENRYMLESEFGENREDIGCDYLIITHDAFYNANDASNPVVRLAEWKRQKGLRTRIVRIGDIGNTAAQIRNYIQTAYKTWSLVPTYVVLIGDANHIRPDYRNDHPSTTKESVTALCPAGATGGHLVDCGEATQRQTGIGTDLYYAAVDGSDPFADIFIGRISAESIADVTNAVNKIITYEMNPPAANAAYYRTTSLVRLFEDDNPADRQEDDGWILIEEAEDLRTHLVDQGYTVERLYGTSGGQVPGPARWEDGDPLPANLTVAGGFAWDADDEDIIAALNAGRFLVTYRGHGWNNGWGSPTLTSGWGGADMGDLDGPGTALNNTGQVPVVFGLTCRAGWFDTETDDADLANYYDCFAEEMLRWPNGGAVAVVASSRNSWGAYNNPMTKAMCDALWPGFDDVGGTDPLRHMGQVYVYGKLVMATRGPAGTGKTATHDMTHLFGDPELVVLTEAPPELAAEHPTAIGETGVQDFIVLVQEKISKAPVGSASVSLTRKGTLVSRDQTDAGGIVRFELSSFGTGDLTITVTKPGMRMYQGTITVSSGGADINVLSPDNGTVGNTIDVGGVSFGANEAVELHLGKFSVTPSSGITTDAAGVFGQSGSIQFDVPGLADLGLVNVVARGATTNRYAVDVFQVRSAVPVDLYTYNQYNSSTWHLANGIKTWNSPSIQLFDRTSGASVSSNNLKALRDYRVEVTIYNQKPNPASNVQVTLEWANFGVGQRVWTPIGNPVTIDVPASSGSGHGSKKAEFLWTPTLTGHICLRARAYHIEDVDADNDYGQENTHVGVTSSPAIIPFEVTNNTAEAGMVHFVIRQIGYANDPEHESLLWSAWVEHPDPQLLQPGETRQIRALVEAPAAATRGAVAEFSLTAYLHRQVIGGINFTIEKGN